MFLQRPLWLGAKLMQVVYKMCFPSLHMCTDAHNLQLSFGGSEWLTLPLQMPKPCFRFSSCWEGEEQKKIAIYFILAHFRQLRGHVKLQFVSLASNKQLIHWSISQLSSWSDETQQRLTERRESHRRRMLRGKTRKRGKRREQRNNEKYMWYKILYCPFT